MTDPAQTLNDLIDQTTASMRNQERELLATLPEGLTLVPVGRPEMQGDDLTQVRFVQQYRIVREEGYCVTSGRPVRYGAGDRCIRHGDASAPCTAALRPAQCEHPHLSPNHPHAHCSECGHDLTRAELLARR
jgi:hypothetical protein